RVAIHFKEIESRRRDRRHVGLLVLLIASLRRAGAPVGEKSRPCLLRLANKDDIGEIAKMLFADADPRTSDCGKAAQIFEADQDAAHALALNAHPRHE